MTCTPHHYVYYQPAPKDPDKIIKVIQDELEENDRFQDYRYWIRAELIRKILKKIENVE